MRKALRLSALVFLFFFSCVPLIRAEETVIVEGKVREVGEVHQEKGIKQQEVSVEILTGSFSGTVSPMKVEILDDNWGVLKPGDHVKVYQTLSSTNQVSLQLAEYNRKDSLIIIYVVLLSVLFGVVGIKGIKNLISSIILFILFAFNLLPLFIKGNYSYEILILFVTTVVGLTAYVRLRNPRFTIFVTLAIGFTLLVGTFVMSGFAQLLHVTPTIDQSDINIITSYHKSIGEIFGIVLIVLSIGAMINIAIQIAKFLIEDIEHKTMTIKEIVNHGFKVGQKAAAGEINNIVSVIFANMLVTLVILEGRQIPNNDFWNNGFVAGQLILVVGSMLNILLLTPIMIVFTALLLKFWKQMPNLQQLQFSVSYFKRKDKKV